ncbi:hypothetical protein BDR03DRAFT_938373 [Suillus americanus]|nr:hypothetical protein BDR03DRAFT_938373 [Suillus americanus]
MGNKIRVELSHGRGRAARRSDDPGACFRCGEIGHWARYVVDGLGHLLLTALQIGNALVYNRKFLS